MDDAVTSYDRAADLIANEENSKRNAIKALDFEASSSLGEMSLGFKKSEDTTLTIESPSRDLALLLSADLKENLKAEVTNRKLAALVKLSNSRALFPALMAASILPVLYSIFSLKHPAMIDISKVSLDDKINYLVQTANARSSVDSGYPALFILVPIAFYIVLGFLTSNLVYPAYTFYWEKEASRYDSEKSLRGKVLWGIIVALIVSLVGAYLARDF